MLYCKNADCGVYLGSMGADSCSLCGHVDQDAIESAACADRDARIAELERELAGARKQMDAQKDEWLSWESKRKALEKDAERYRWLLDNYATGDGYDLIDRALNDGEADTQLTPAIDAAMKGQQ